MFPHGTAGTLQKIFRRLPMSAIGGKADAGPVGQEVRF